MVLEVDKRGLILVNGLWRLDGRSEEVDWFRTESGWKSGGRFIEAEHEVCGKLVGRWTEVG